MSSPGSSAGTGPYVNFSRYIDANKDVANSTASSVAGEVDKSASKAQTGLQAAQGKFQQGMQAGSPFATTPRAMAASAQATMPNPMARFQAQGVTPSTTTAEQARQRAGATYTGPTGLGVSDQLRTDTTAAGKQLAATGTDAGRQALLQQQYGQGGGYTQGMSSLDAALTGSVGGKQFSALRAKYGDLNGKLEGGERAAREQAANAAASTSTTASNYATQAADFEAADRERQRQAAAIEAQAALRAQAAQTTQAAQGSAKPATTGAASQAAQGVDAARAAKDGLYNEWVRAGKPPYDKWKASRKH